MFGKISKEARNTNSKECKHPSVHCGIIYNHHTLEEAQVPVSRGVDAKAVVCSHNGILLSHKKEDLTFCNSMDGPGEHCAK